MKKQLRIFLFVTMLLLLLGVTVLAVSAAGEWKLYPTQTDANNGTNKKGDYDTLGDAIAAIDGSNQVIKLTADITLSDKTNDPVTLNKGKSTPYIIDGGSHTLTFTYRDAALWTINDNVTIHDIDIVRNNYSNHTFDINNGNTVVFHNVHMRGSDALFGSDSITTPVHISFTGDTSITETDNSIFPGAFSNGSKGGEILFNSTGEFYTSNTAKDGCYKGKFPLVNGLCHGIKFTFQNGVFTHANSSPMITYSDNDWISPVEITGGTFNITSTGGIVEVKGNEANSVIGRCYASGIGEDIVRISGGTFNLTGAGYVVYSHIAYPFKTKDGSTNTGTHPQITIGGATISYTGVSGAYFIKDASTSTGSSNVIINITNGTFDGSVCVCSDGGTATVNVTGGTFKSKTTEYGFLRGVSGSSTFNVSGGTFAGGPNWITTTDASVFNIYGTAAFTSEYPEGGEVYTTVNPGSNGFIYSSNGSRAGGINFYGNCTVVNNCTENFIIRGSGIPVTVSGSASITTSAPFAYLFDNAYISPVHISGGTFTVNDAGSVVKVNSDTASSLGQPCSAAGLGNDIIRISGGTFHIADSGYIIYTYVHYNLRSIVDKPDGAISSGRPTITISNGNFTSSATGIMFYDQSTKVTASPIYQITGGTFGNTGRYVGGNGSAIFNIGTYGDNSKPTFTSSTNYASGGVFHLQNAHGDNNGELNFNGCTVNYSGSQQFIHGMGGIVNVRGGVFNITNAQFFYTADPDVVSPLFISSGTFNIGKQLAYYNYQFAVGKGDRFPQVTTTTYDRNDNVILEITGGTFNFTGVSNGAAILGFFDGTTIKASGQLNTSLPVQLNIAGGTFTNKVSVGGDDTNTIHSFIYDQAPTRSRASADFVPIIYNITGNASFRGHVWLDLHGENTYNIGTANPLDEQPSFHCGSSLVDGGAMENRVLWLRNSSIGGTLNIYGGSFTANSADTMMLNAAGATVNISGGSFEFSGYGICLQDSDRSSIMTISGGEFTSNSAYPCVQFSAGEKGGNTNKGSITITNGTFTGTTALSYTTVQTASGELPFCRVSGGTFNGNIVHTATTHPMLITGGRFTAGSGFEGAVPGRGYVGVTDDSTYKRVTAANLHGFAGSQMRLGTDLGVYFYVLTIDAVDSGTPSLVVSDEAGTLATLSTLGIHYTIETEYPDGSAVESGYTLYRFAFDGLPPQRLGDDLDVVFKLTGVAKFANEFSGLRYCRQVRAENPGDDELLAITGALLNFGAAAQTYSGYRTETLVNATAADITGATAFSAVSEKLAAYGGTLGTPHFVKTEENGVAARGVRFDTGIQLYARVIDTTGATTCTYSVAGGDAVACEKVDLGGNRYAFYTGAITLDHFGDNVVFTLSTGETCTYSVQAFVYYYQNLDAKANEKALARALWAYKTAVVGASFNGWAGFDVADVVNP